MVIRFKFEITRPSWLNEEKTDEIWPFWRSNRSSSTFLMFCYQMTKYFRIPMSKCPYYVPLCLFRSFTWKWAITYHNFIYFLFQKLIWIGFNLMMCFFLLLFWCEREFLHSNSNWLAYRSFVQNVELKSHT